MNTYQELRDYCDMSREDAVEVMHYFREDDNDFEVGGYRFIRNDELDATLAEHLFSDTYTLGCFAAWFVVEQLGNGLPVRVIELMQEAELFEAVGLLIESICEPNDFAEAAARADSHGHFLNSYDGEQLEIGDNYTAFRTA